MSDFKDGIDDILAEGIDALDKIRTPKSRSADAIERCIVLLEADIPSPVIALLMEENTGESFSEQDVCSYDKLYKVSRSTVAITKKQTVGLVRHQKGKEDGSFPKGYPA
ncbi:hypothetical protein [Vibrio mediterranei]|uniref:hypothetical protein n=1 Tax=Vibrio mediterranei TaxID=689 RepID=UPI001EFC5AED|nr:hypothetical protein [Vibrio mediterranei]MCG9657947.1 hypothetical protein [Vibrio mediterranei]